MKKIQGINNMAVFQLIIIALAIAPVSKKISRDKFMRASFQERIEMLKVAFEKLLIECKESISIYIGSDMEEDRKTQEEVLEISKAIEATCKKRDKEDNIVDSVLFRCFLHNDNTPSMSWSARQHGFYCFGCSKDNEVFDLFDCIKIMNGLKGPTAFKEAYQIAVKILVEDGYTIENPFSDITKGVRDKHSSYIPYTREMNKIRHYTFYYPITNDELAIKKLSERGINLKTAKNHAVMTWYPTTASKTSFGLAYWVFINDDGSYSRRLFSEDKNLREKWYKGQVPLKWWNQANKQMGLFNVRVIEHCRQFKEVCFVTESAIDALSCEELGYHAVGLNSISNLSSFFREYIDKQADIMLICLTDNDKAGKGNIEGFIERGLFVPDYLQVGYTGNRWLNGFKDVNEALVADRKETLFELQRLEKEAKNYYKKQGDK